MDGVSGLDVLTWVLRVMPAIVPVAAMLLAIHLWFRLLIIGRMLRARGEERLGLYSDFVVSSFGLVGAFFVLGWADWRLGGDTPPSQVMWKLRLTTYTESDVLIGVSALLLLTYFAIALISSSISAYLGEKESPYAVALRPRTTVERFVWVTAMSPTAGFCEEIIFRGVLLTLIAGLTDDVVIAVWISSFLFALGHAVYGVTWMVGTMVLGIASAIAVVWSGSLWPAIIAHTIYDMTVYYVFEGSVPEPTQPVPEPARFKRFLRSLPPMH